MKRIALIGVLALAALGSYKVEATSGLAIVCPIASEEGKTIPTSCGGSGQSGQIYKTPAIGDLVRVDPTAVEGGGADWAATNTDYVWMKWPLPAGMLYETCKTDVPEGTSTSGNLCQAWVFVRAAAMSIPMFSVTPVIGKAPLTVKVSWSVIDGTSCAAGGSWSGAKAATGTEDLVLDAGAKSFALTCTRPIGAPVKGNAVLTWTPATLNTDDSAYVNPKGVIITRNAAETLVTPPAVVTYTFSALDPGTHTFKAQSINTADTRSDYTPDLVKTIPSVLGPAPWSATPVIFTVDAPVAVPSKPKAPVLSVQ